ncbi:MAG: response regulator [Calditrichaceae bacterium]|nr:response regulator [Calditrichaceae bacterium]
MDRKALILIADDSISNRKMLQILLEKDGYETTCLDNGKDAIEKTALISPDLILLDIMMPGADGYEVCKTLKKSRKTKNIPIIFITAKTETESIVEGFEAGASDYVRKPFNSTELLARVKTHLDLTRSFHNLRESQERILKLEQLNTILAMAGTANHDINQPLTVISGNLYLLEESLKKMDLSIDQKKNIQEIKKSINRIKEILEQYSRAVDLRYKEYAGGSKIVILDDGKDQKKL